MRLAHSLPACLFVVGLSLIAQARVGSQAKREPDRLSGHTERVEYVASSADGRLHASGDADGKVIVWDSEKKKGLAQFKAHERMIRALAFSEDGGLLLTAGHGDNFIRAWDPKIGKELKPILTDENLVSFLTASKDGGMGAAMDFSRLIIWDLKKGTDLHRLDVFPGYHSFACFSSEGALLTGTFGVPRLFAWDAKAGKLLFVIETGHGLYCAAFPSQGNVLYAGAFNQPILVVDVEERKVTRRLGKGAGHINALAVSPDGALLAGAYEKGVLKVWDVKADKEVYYFQAHISLRAISFVCKGQKLVSNGGGNDVLVHDLSHLAQVPVQPRPSDKP